MKTLLILVAILFCFSCENKVKIIQEVKKDPTEFPVIKSRPYYLLGQKLDDYYLDWEVSEYVVITQTSDYEYFDAHWFKSLDMVDSVSKIEYCQAINYLRKQEILDSINHNLPTGNNN